jgi:hypothetical protein
MALLRENKRLHLKKSLRGAIIGAHLAQKSHREIAEQFNVHVSQLIIHYKIQMINNTFSEKYCVQMDSKI